MSAAALTQDNLDIHGHPDISWGAVALRLNEGADLIATGVSRTSHGSDQPGTG